MSEPPKIHVLLGGKQDDPHADLLARAEAQFASWTKLYAFEARRKKVMFDELVNAGFTEEQALSIVK